MRACGASSGLCAPTFDDDNRFAAAHALGKAHKTAWVAERFEVEQNDFGVFVFFPILNQVITRHIRFVAEANKG